MNFYFAATTIWSAENEKGWITTLVGESLFLSTLRAIEIKLKMQTSVELHACTVPEKMFERTLSGYRRTPSLKAKSRESWDSQQH
jgi:hypothetical protein